jgi:hypothetical protein
MPVGEALARRQQAGKAGRKSFSPPQQSGVAERR